jgi:hypothetical protein
MALTDTLLPLILGSVEMKQQKKKLLDVRDKVR